MAYCATLAPSVTLWDSGEFLAAIRTLGTPHPPGTPLFIYASKAWATLLGWLPFDTAVNLGSAASAAVAAAIFALLFARWTGRAPAGLAGAMVGGTTATLWQSATETEVYSHVLLAVALALLVADHAGRRESARYRTLAALIFGLAVPLHISVLIAGPAVVLLASTDGEGRFSWRVALMPGAAWSLAAGIGTVSPTLVFAGLATFLAAALLGQAAGEHVGGGEQSVVWRRAAPREAALALAVTALGASFLLVMLVRAHHDPAINEGNPTSWGALAELVGRRQYDVPPLWPRRAPPWLQLGNLVQYADWQVASSLSDSPGASAWRTPFSVLFALLAVLGARWHRRRDRRSWNVIALLALCASVGVVTVLNLRAGPSFGWGGVLPETAVREARERDYFFALAFLVAGLWSGCGVVALVERWRSPLRHSLWLLAALPLVLNWRAVDRSRPGEATRAADIANALLRRLPQDAVLVLAGDNDSFPVWFAQQVEGLRPDVTPITLPLLGARWYREELHRRYDLLPADVVARWRGRAATLETLGRASFERERPLVAAVSLAPDDRRTLAPAQGWRLQGMWYLATPDSGSLPALSIDSAGVAEAAAWWRDRRARRGTVEPARDPASRYVDRLLRCPDEALRAVASADTVGSVLLESICNYR